MGRRELLSLLVVCSLYAGGLLYFGPVSCDAPGIKVRSPQIGGVALSLCRNALPAAKKREERGKRIPSNFEPSFVIPPIFTTAHKIIGEGGRAAARERQAYSERRGSVHCENSDKQATGRGKGEQAGKAHWQAGKGKKAIEARLSSQSIEIHLRQYHPSNPSSHQGIYQRGASIFNSSTVNRIHRAHPFLIVLLQTLPAVLATSLQD